MKMDLKSNRQRRRITIRLYDKYKKLLMQMKEQLQPETQQQSASAAAPSSQAMDLNDLACNGKNRACTQFCRIKGCSGVGVAPLPIIFERLKLPQQIIYRRKENLSDSPNHLKY